MHISHVADDFAAIARRLKEIQEESRAPEARTQQPTRRANVGYQLDRYPAQGGDTGRPRNDGERSSFIVTAPRS